MVAGGTTAFVSSSFRVGKPARFPGVSGQNLASVLVATVSFPFVAAENGTPWRLWRAQRKPAQLTAVDAVARPPNAHKTRGSKPGEVTSLALPLTA